VVTIVLIALAFAIAVGTVVMPQHLRVSENSRQPKLIAQPSRGISGEPAPLGLALRGSADDAVVIVRGLMPGMELSAGRALVDGAWQLPATDLPMPGLLRRQGLSARLSYLPNCSCLIPKSLIVSRYTWNGRHRPSAASRNESGSRLDGSKRRRRCRPLRQQPFKMPGSGVSLM
jgi:hypothetical protein